MMSRWRAWVEKNKEPPPHTSTYRACSQPSHSQRLGAGKFLMIGLSTAASWAGLRRWWCNVKAIALVPDVAELRSINSRLDMLALVPDIVAELRSINSRLDMLDYHSHGARAVYVGNSRVLMKAVVGGAQIAFLLEGDDRLLSPWFIVSGRYETELTDFFLLHLNPDSHCIDVGANFGYYTCLMARFCPSGRVFAIEADEHVAALVRDNIAINGFNTGIAEALHAAASDSAKPLTLYRRITRSGNTSLLRMPDDVLSQLGEPVSEPFDVAGMCIDELLPRLEGRVDFIKIDVEGSEPLALRGARETIKRNPHLTIVMEWSPGQIQAAGFDVPAFLSELDEMSLQAFDTAGKQLGRNDLLAAPYFTGIVLRHR
jgi:FkbM family methyltransferase